MSSSSSSCSSFCRLDFCLVSSSEVEDEERRDVVVDEAAGLVVVVDDEDEAAAAAIDAADAAAPLGLLPIAAIAAWSLAIASAEEDIVAGNGVMFSVML